MRKQAQFINTKGMNQDLSISKFNPEFIYEGMNIRLNSGDEGTMFTITNERGNVKANVSAILGTAIGYCVIGEYLVIFTTTREATTWKDQKKDIPLGIDRIYRLERWQHFETVFNLRSTLLFEGSKENSLNFSKNAPIETLGLIEGENVQKVYWVDDNNQPRLINIVDTNYQEYVSTSFDFVPELQLEEKFEVTKQNYGGNFHSGVIQYAFSYWNLNGVESNIIHTTPLYYITQGNRAGSPDEICSNSFKIEGENIEGNIGNRFDFLRIYCIQRTTLEVIPIIRKVTDVNIKDKNTFSVIDNGVVGEIFDIELFNLIGGNSVIINTLSEKDNVLFGGNIKIKSPRVLALQERFINNKGADFSFEWSYAHENKFKEGNDKNTVLDKDSSTIKSWKVGETYRYGIQLQYANGSWSAPIWIGKDVKNTQGIPDVSNDQVYICFPRVWLTDSLLDLLEDMGVKYIRPMYVPLTMSNRTVVAQGFLTSTIFNLKDRISESTYAQPDYLTRPNKDTLSLDGTLQAVSDFYPIVSTHFTPISGVKKTNPLKIYTNNAHKDTSSASTKENFEYVNYTLPEINQKTISPLINNNTLLPLESIDFTTFELLTNIRGIEYIPSASFIYGDPGTFIGHIEKGKSYKIVYTIRETMGNDWHIDITYEDNIIVRKNPIKKPFNGNSNMEAIEVVPPLNFIVLSFNAYSFKTGAIYKSIIDHDKLNVWSIDKNLINFWSPEVEFGQLTESLIETTSLSLQAVAFSEKTDTFIKATNTLDVSLDFYKDSVNNNSFLKTDDNISIWDSFPSINTKKLETSRRVDLNKRLYYNLGENVFNITTPHIINKEDNFIVYPSKIKTEEKGLHNVNVIYSNNIEEVLQLNSTQSTFMNYKGNDHIIFSLLTFKYKVVNQEPIVLPEINTIGSGYILKSPYYEVRDMQLNRTWSPVSIQTPIIKDSKITSQWNTPYIWIADLVRKIDNQYGGDTIEFLQNSLWVPCGKKTSTKGRAGDGGAVADGLRGTLIYTEGDTYFQKYDCLRIQPNLNDNLSSNIKVNQYKEMVSVWLETFINLEGRYDDKKNVNNVFNVNWNNYNKLNNVYNQLNNLEQRYYINEAILKEDNLFSTFMWSTPKLYNEFIDTWTKIKINNSYTTSGIKGQINKLINYNNSLLGFQDKGIFEILYNKRIQVNPSDGEPIELAQSNKVEGIRYITDSIGAIDKEAIKISNKALYFIDKENKNLYSFSGEGLKNLSEDLGFKKWSNNVIKDSNKQKTFVDNIKNNIYFTEDNQKVLGYSERLQQFESFYTYGESAYMDNIWGEFFSIKNTLNGVDIWFNNKGNYNSFFGEPKPSWITYYINPEFYIDKVFDNFIYRADFFEDNILKHRETFSKIIIENEYQNNEINLLLRGGSIFGNKKFRQWAYPFPRQNNSLNRIRNPWVKLQLYFNGNGNRKFQLHDLIISYTV